KNPSVSTWPGSGPVGPCRPKTAKPSLCPPTTVILSLPAPRLPVGFGLPLASGPCAPPPIMPPSGALQIGPQSPTPDGIATGIATTRHWVRPAYAPLPTPMPCLALPSASLKPGGPPPPESVVPLGSGLPPPP